jgi:hypothetical protein
MDASAQTTPKARKLILLILVIVVLLGAIGGIAVFVLKHQTIDAARFLRPQETIAVFTHAEQKAWKPYAKLLPVLDLVPAITSTDATLAIIKRGNTLGWVVLGNLPLTATKAQLAFVTPTMAYESSMSDWQPANEADATLEAYPPFLQLIGQAPEDVPVAYMDMQQLRAEARTPLDMLLLNGTKRWPAVLTWKDGSRVQTLLYGFTAQSTGAFAPRLPSWTPGGYLVFTVDNGMSAWKALMDFLPARERLVLQGRLSAILQHALGRDVSMQYDLLPLLKNGTSFALTQSGFLIEGHSTGVETDKSLALIMESVRQSMPQSTVDRHVFERGFTSTIISPSSSAIVERYQKSDGFDVHTLWSVAQNRGIALARKGNAFRLTNDFSQVISTDTAADPALNTVPLVSPMAQAEALLWVRAKDLQSILQETLGIAPDSDILPGSPNFVVALRREGAFTRLVVDQQP